MSGIEAHAQNLETKIESAKQACIRSITAFTEFKNNVGNSNQLERKVSSLAQHIIDLLTNLESRLEHQTSNFGDGNIKQAIETLSDTLLGMLHFNELPTRTIEQAQAARPVVKGRTQAL